MKTRAPTAAAWVGGRSSRIEYAVGFRVTGAWRLLSGGGGIEPKLV